MNKEEIKLKLTVIDMLKYDIEYLKSLGLRLNDELIYKKEVLDKKKKVTKNNADLYKILIYDLVKLNDELIKTKELFEAKVSLLEELKGETVISKINNMNEEEFKEFFNSLEDTEVLE